MTTSDLPVRFEAALTHLLADQPPPASLAVALSGGADSWACLLLAQGWARQRQIPVMALIVDHGLRRNSAAEAQEVATLCHARDLRVRILSGQAAKASQSAARSLRYDLLQRACAEEEISHLLTGHQAQDQLETGLIRLLRGSGARGMAGMSARRILGSVMLLRPCLAFTPEELRAFCHAQNLRWIEDPSNQETRYLRNWLRGLEDDSYAGLREVMQDCAQIRRRIEEYSAQALAESVSLRPGGWLFLDRTRLMAYSPPVRQVLLAHLLHVIGGQPHPTPPPDWENHAKAVTCGGCVLMPWRMGWALGREARNWPPSGRYTGRWDHRFRLEGAHIVSALADCKEPLAEVDRIWLKSVPLPLRGALPVIDGRLNHPDLHFAPVVPLIFDPFALV